MSSSSSSSDSFSSESDSENRLTRTSKKNASWKGKKKQLESGIQQTT